MRREDCYVVGDAVWDLLAARRAGMLSVGLLSGGYGEDELTQAGAFRVYRDAQDLFDSLRRARRHAARIRAGIRRSAAVRRRGRLAFRPVAAAPAPGSGGRGAFQPPLVTPRMDQVA